MSQQNGPISRSYWRLHPTTFFFFFFYSICSSVSLPMLSRRVFESYYVSLSRFVMFVVIVLDDLWIWRFPCRKTLAASWFPRRVAVLRSCLYSPSTSKISDVGTLCIRVQPAMSTDSLARVPLTSVGLQPIKNLLFIVRIYCPYFWFWSDILRPLISFPLQKVEILYVCFSLEYLCQIQFYVMQMFKFTVCAWFPKMFCCLLVTRIFIALFQVHLC